jgi:hypothetical protein
MDPLDPNPDSLRCSLVLPSRMSLRFSPEAVRTPSCKLFSRTIYINKYSVLHNKAIYTEAIRFCTCSVDFSSAFRYHCFIDPMGLLNMEGRLRVTSQTRLACHLLQHCMAGEFVCGSLSPQMDQYYSSLGTACLLGPSELAQTVTLLACIHEVPGSSLIGNTSCPNWGFSWLYSVTKGNSV